MRVCPICQLAFRAHDPGHLVMNVGDQRLDELGWPRGGYQVCHDCFAQGYPELWTPLAVRVPAGNADPARDPQALYWCPCCRNYAREDDPIAHSFACLRVLQEDLDAFPTLQPRPKPGALRCCRACWKVWAPIVRLRWVRQGIVSPRARLAALGTNLV